MTRRAAPLLLILLVGMINAPLLLHPNDLLYPRGGQVTDLTITHWPAIAYNVDSLRRYGQIPLWRTTIASGGLWVANPQSWLLYPPAWLFFLLPINRTFNLLLLSHSLLAALATYTFGRRALRMRPAGAALAGLAFALSPWLTAHLAAGHVNIAWALAWLPVALLGVHRAAATGDVKGALGAGVAWTAALLNHLQMAAFVIVCSVAWFLLIWLTADAPVSLGRRIVPLWLMSTVALLLSAVLLIPLAEAWPYLNRATLTPDRAGLFSLPWAGLLTAFIPTYGGEPEQVIYLGLPPALLALAGASLRRDRITWFFLLSAGLAALFALGSYGPLFPLLTRFVPGLSWFRVPPRIWGWVTFSLAILAGRGLDILSESLTARDRRRAGVTGAALVAGLTAAAGFALQLRTMPLAVWNLGAFTVLSAVTVWLRIQGRLRPVPFALLALLLTGADLSVVRAAWTEMRAPAAAFAWGAEAARFLAAQPGRFRVYSPSYSLPQHTALQYHLSLADGVDPFQLSHYADFLARAGGYQVEGYTPTLPPDLDNHRARPDAARLGWLNVGYVASEWPIEAEGLVWVATISNTLIYRNERVLPRAFVAEVQGSDAVALSQPIELAPAEIAVYTPNRIVVEAEPAEGGLLVLGEVWYPGWRARVDGLEAPVQRVEGVLRGVWLEAGRHTIEFSYSPWTVWAGLTVTGGTTVVLLGWAAYWLWRRR